MIGKLVEHCCWFFSLQIGSFLIGCYIIGSNILGIAHLVDVSDDHTPDLSEARQRHLAYSIFGGAFISGAMVIVGVAILVGLLTDKYKLVKYSSVGFVILAALRIVASIWRVIEGRLYDSFVAIFVVTLFYFYCFVVLWSYCQEEEAENSMTCLSDTQLKLLLRQGTIEASDPSPNKPPKFIMKGQGPSTNAR